MKHAPASLAVCSESRLISLKEIRVMMASWHDVGADEKLRLILID